MKLQKTFFRTCFSEEAIHKAVAEFDRYFLNRSELIARVRLLTVQHGGEIWTFDDDADFFAALPKCDSAQYGRYICTQDREQLPLGEGASFLLKYYDEHTSVYVEAEQSHREVQKRAAIRAVAQVLSHYEDQCKQPSRSGPVIFIGHGHSPAWREVKDHLTDKHGYRVEAYETGARAGHTIRDILQSMLERSSFALMVLTREDETADGSFRARQNVVHETGLFQGKLGFARAIVLLEEGTESFTNIDGVEQIRFTKIQESFGDVVATLKREFGQVGEHD